MSLRVDCSNQAYNMMEDKASEEPDCSSRSVRIKYCTILLLLVSLVMDADEHCFDETSVLYLFKRSTVSNNSHMVIGFKFCIF